MWRVVDAHRHALAFVSELRETSIVRLAVITTLSAALLACGAESNAPDASADVGAPDAGLEWPELQVGSMADPNDPTRIGPGARPADLSCLDQPPPTPGAAQPSTFALHTFGATMPLAGVCARVYPSNVTVPADTCAPSDLHADAMGRVTITVPTFTPYALRIFAQPGPNGTTLVDTTTFHDVTPWTTSGLGISRSDEQLVPAVLGRTLVPGTSIATASVIDCTGANMYGARARLVRADGSYLVLGPRQSDAYVTYFNAAGVPSRTQPWTHVGGELGFGNIVPAMPGEIVLIEISGRPTGAAAPRVIACEQAQIVPDGIALVNFLAPTHQGGLRCPAQ
jgi:hypothetical protein